ncbi:MAG TPA: sugar transferase [Thermoanaerobaculia bacterium]|nr:sugar transferase [Thermoanaerobaculia bacterium]
MLKQQARLLNAALFVLDLALVAAAAVVAHGLRSVVLPAILPALFSEHFYPLRAYLPLVPLAVSIWAALLLVLGEYRSHRTVPLLDEAWDVVRASITGSVIFTLAIYVFRLDEALLGEDLISRSWILLFSALACLFVLAEKVALRLTSRYFRASGYNYRTVVIVGTGASGQMIADSIREHRFWGFRILGMIESGSESDAETPPLLPVLGKIEDLPRIVENNIVDDVIFAIGRRDLDRMEDLFLSLQERGIRTRFALRLFPHTPAKVELEELDGLPLLSFSPAPNGVVALAAKRCLDIALSTLLLMLGLPIIVVIAAAIKISSSGTVLYRQTRCGLNGRLFTMYKFRTMEEGAHDRRRELLALNEMTGPAFKLRRDPRVTSFGRFLRRSSLDELPQLWNVLRGEMSLVGPRPPMPEEVAQYQPWQRRRLAMKPGLTCLWQISGRSDTRDFNQWMALDLEYIDSWSPTLDVKILLKTIPVVLSGKGAS